MAKCAVCAGVQEPCDPVLHVVGAWMDGWMDGWNAAELPKGFNLQCIIHELSWQQKAKLVAGHLNKTLRKCNFQTLPGPAPFFCIESGVSQILNSYFYLLILQRKVSAKKCKVFWKVSWHKWNIIWYLFYIVSFLWNYWLLICDYCCICIWKYQTFLELCSIIEIFVFV